MSSPSLRSLLLPPLERAFTGPMTSKRVAALLHVALWSLGFMSGTAVSVATATHAAGWGWELFKTLSQFVIAALGAGFAYSFPARINAQKAYQELRAEALRFSAQLVDFAKDQDPATSPRPIRTASSDLRARMESAGTAPAILEAIDAAAEAAGLIAKVRLGVFEFPVPAGEPPLSRELSVKMAQLETSMAAARLAEAVISEPPP